MCSWWCVMMACAAAICLSGWLKHIGVQACGDCMLLGLHAPTHDFGQDCWTLDRTPQHDLLFSCATVLPNAACLLA